MEQHPAALSRTQQRKEVQRQEHLERIKAKRIKRKERRQGANECKWKAYGCQEALPHQNNCQYQCQPGVEKLWILLRAFAGQYPDFKPDLWGILAPKAYQFGTVAVHQKTQTVGGDTPLLFDPTDLWLLKEPEEYKVFQACFKEGLKVNQ